MSSFYSREVFDHFRKPRNARAMDSPDGTGRAINEACSDVVQMFIRVDGDTLSEVTFQAQGCVACIASASITTVLATGKSFDDALGIDKFVIARELGELPENKVDCSLISPIALREAINEYNNRAS
jgi:nitrogen fixation NifU-like protein